MKVIYFSLSKLENSENAVYIKGLKTNGVEIAAFTSGGGGLKKYKRVLDFYWQNKKNTDLIMIGFESPELVILMKVFSRKKIIYNSIVTVYERLIISRNLVKRWSLKSIYYWLIDFFAFHFSDLIMLETNHQVDFVSSSYFIAKNRLFQTWAGANDKYFFYEPTVAKLPNFTVIFRGAFIPEAGTEYAIRAAKVLEDKNIKFVIMGGGILLKKIKELIDELKPANLELMTNFLPYEKLRETMQKCHLSLGQLSDHNRLTRTIPHKAYESLAMKLPYLTASNAGILELLIPNKTCLTCNSADVKSLAEKVLWVKNNYSQAQEIAKNAYKLHQDKLRPHILAKNLIERIKAL